MVVAMSGVVPFGVRWWTGLEGFRGLCRVLGVQTGGSKTILLQSRAFRDI